MGRLQGRTKKIGWVLLCGEADSTHDLFVPGSHWVVIGKPTMLLGFPTVSLLFLTFPVCEHKLVVLL